MFWKKLFGIDVIYYRQLGSSFLPIVVLIPLSLIVFIIYFILHFGGELVAGLRFLSAGIVPLYGVLVAAVVVSTVLRAVKIIYIKRQLKKRDYKGSADTYSPTRIAGSAVSQELDNVDNTKLIIEGRGWKIYDAVFDVMHRGRRGHRKVGESYYTVFEAKLVRAVPHLLFDSSSAKGKQFKHLYLKAQKLAVDSALEESFEAYAPKYYEIDALSFITPEVVEAMLAMSRYDIELLRDGLLCYAPLLPDEDMEGFKARCLNLQRHLNDNLRAYKDDRLASGRDDDVTDFGQQLLRNHFRNLPLIIVLGVILIGLVAFNLFSSTGLLFSHMTVVIALSFGTLTFNMVKLMRDNKRKEALFLSGQKKDDFRTGNRDDSTGV